MFEVQINEFSSKTDKLLSNICELLQEQNKLLKQFSHIGNSDIPVQENNSIEANYDAMERKQLVEIIKKLPKGTVKGKYMTMPLEELRKAVKEVMQCKV